MGASRKEPYVNLEPCTRDYHKCHEKDDHRLESMCGKEEEDELIIACSAEPSEEHFCFEVKQSERAFIFEGGELFGEVDRPGSYKFERRFGVRIMWVWKNEFKMEYGVPKSANLISKDGESIGFHGTALTSVDDAKKFVEQFSEQQKVTTCTLREKVLGYIIDAFREPVGNMDKKEFMSKRSDKIFLKSIVDRLYTLFDAYGINIKDITIEGFAPDC